MTKKQVKYRVIRGINVGKFRHEPGAVVAEADLRDAPIERWLETGVLEEAQSGDRKD